MLLLYNKATQKVSDGEKLNMYLKDQRKNQMVENCLPFLKEKHKVHS